MDFRVSGKQVVQGSFGHFEESFLINKATVYFAGPEPLPLGPTVLAKTVGPKTLQTCHTLQIFFRLFPRRITTRFAVPIRKSVGVLCF